MQNHEELYCFWLIKEINSMYNKFMVSFDGN